MCRTHARLIAVTLALLAMEALASNDVRGNLEGVYWRNSTYLVEGWACAYGISESVDVDVYAGAPWPMGTMLGGTRADVLSEPGVSTACGSSLNRHRFRFQLPQHLLKQHAGKPLYAYAHLVAHGVNNLVPGSGQISIPASPYNGLVRGSVEGVYWRTDGYYLEGWTCAYGVNQSVELNVYAGGPWPSGTLFHGGLADVASEPALSAACNTSLGRHRFRIRLSDPVLAQFQGQPLYVYAMVSGTDITDLVAGNPTVPAVATVLAPSPTPVAGTYNTPVNVTLSSSTSGASVYYTLDGTTPTCGAGSLYTTPIPLSSATTVRAIACKSGSTASTVTTAAYAFAAAPPLFSPIGGTYSSAQSITLSTTTPGATLHYTLDGSTPVCGAPSLTYSVPFTVSMTRTVHAVACRAGFTSSTPASATYTLSISNWTGPAASIVTVNGGKRISVNGQVLSPLHHAFNLQACKTDCVAEDAVIDLQLAELARTQTFGTRFVVEVASIGYRGAGAINRLATRLRKVRLAYPGFDPYLIVRFDLFDIEESTGSCAPGEDYQSSTYMALYNNQGTRYSANALCGQANGVLKPYKRINAAWLTTREVEISTVADLLEAEPETRGRVIGLSFTYLAGGEFFYAPRHVSGHDTGAVFPWDPLHTSAFFFQDDSGTPAATLTNRMTENFGIFLAGSTKAAAVQLSRAEVDNLVAAISRMAAHVKNITGGKALNKVFYGYSYGPNARRAFSMHHGLATLLLDPNIDIVAAPFSYQQSRRLGFGLSPQTSIEAVTRSGKHFEFEGDIRTHFAVLDDPWRHATTIEETNRLLVRDGLTAAIHGTGLYYFDLNALGWLGRPDSPTETASLWNTLKNTSTLASTVASTGSVYAPQIAVFVDEQSVSHYPLDGLGGAPAYQFATATMMGQIEALSRVGAPAQHYLLSDLATLDTSHLRLAIFPDAYKLSVADKQRIQQKLAGNGRTLLYLYAPGVIDGNGDAADANVSSTLGMPVSRRTNTPAFAATSYMDGSGYPHDGLGGPLSLGNFPLQYRVDVGGTGAALCPNTSAVNCIDSRMLSRYANSTDVAFAVKRVSDASGTYKVAFAAVPGVPTSMLRDVARDAGVHVFSCTPGGACMDAVVEASDNTLLLHAVGPMTTLNMPLTRSGCGFSVSEWVGITTTTSPTLVPIPCTGNQCQVNVSESLGVRVYRLTPSC
ncbi:chitobiase/beta-hexosaminidase C-terminal domain-containing protein [Myxococcus sp. K38C18041901]|uniref:chitobiase/beta-hexosaminidase C-terminal domain-containing protein n=1 Tax=Myxococcus guangdongensis TaxID=2906760 RepID=UPI0020A7E585|nr:chitobiase/beta-hexosaminidase C-terminal domain-containing protein [Myxococcus guangdongensis]MCP3057699.1 chitobiase/beta-hexosaminidase C-terminal domain-containing protein [Myxococcus guangdongensis]